MKLNYAHGTYSTRWRRELLMVVSIVVAFVASVIVVDRATGVYIEKAQLEQDGFTNVRLSYVMPYFNRPTYMEFRADYRGAPVKVETRRGNRFRIVRAASIERSKL